MVLQPHKYFNDRNNQFIENLSCTETEANHRQLLLQVKMTCKDLKDHSSV